MKTFSDIFQEDMQVGCSYHEVFEDNQFNVLDIKAAIIEFTLYDSKDNAIDHIAGRILTFNREFHMHVEGPYNLEHSIHRSINMIIELDDNDFKKMTVFAVSNFFAYKEIGYIWLHDIPNYLKKIFGNETHIVVLVEKEIWYENQKELEELGYIFMCTVDDHVELLRLANRNELGNFA